LERRYSRWLFSALGTAPLQPSEQRLSPSTLFKKTHSLRLLPAGESGERGDAAHLSASRYGKPALPDLSNFDCYPAKARGTPME